jgi:hypothetical protein
VQVLAGALGMTAAATANTAAAAQGALGSALAQGGDAKRRYYLAAVTGRHLRWL